MKINLWVVFAWNNYFGCRAVPFFCHPQVKKLLVRCCFFVVGGALFLSGQTYAADIELDPKLQDYKKVNGIGGQLNSIGSDTLNNLVTFWAESFSKYYPNVKIQIEGKGSATAPPSLAEGLAQIGPMSRPMKNEERQAILDKKPGLEIIEIGVALDGLAVFVHKDNPLQQISLAQLDAVFSSTLKRRSKAINFWGDLGLTGGWSKKAVRVYGRNSASGTYSYFKEAVLAKGDFKNSVKERPGSAAVVQSIAEDLYGLGYSGMGFITSNVRALPVSKDNNGKAYEPNYTNVLEENYPISRILYIYALKKKGSSLPRVVEEFFKLIVSKQGQQVVVKDGFLPLNSYLADLQRKKL